MQQQPEITVAHASEITSSLRASILALCKRAYGQDIGQLFTTFVEPTHVHAFLDGLLVSHAMWVTRWLQPLDLPPLRTAYVEMVATEPSRQRRGLATAVMGRLGSAISEYDVGALSPAGSGVYIRLGWVFWRGPLFIRLADQWIPTPDERIMIQRLPKTPRLDLSQPLSAEWRQGELW